MSSIFSAAPIATYSPLLPGLDRIRSREKMKAGLQKRRAGGGPSKEWYQFARLPIPRFRYEISYVRVMICSTKKKEVRELVNSCLSDSEVSSTIWRNSQFLIVQQPASMVQSYHKSVRRAWWRLKCMLIPMLKLQLITGIILITFLFFLLRGPTLRPPTKPTQNTQTCTWYAIQN